MNDYNKRCTETHLITQIFVIYLGHSGFSHYTSVVMKWMWWAQISSSTKNTLVLEPQVVNISNANGKKKYTKIYNPILVLIDHEELNLIGNYKKDGRCWQFPTI